jgi:hypothetical protein
MSQKVNRVAQVRTLHGNGAVVMKLLEDQPIHTRNMWPTE